MTSKIVTLTMNPTLDIGTSIDQVAPDRKLRTGDVRYDPGGGGVNVARAVKRLGGTPTALFVSGAVFGDIVGELLQQEGVRHQRISVAGKGRIALAVAERSSGQQYRFVLPGPPLRPTECDAVLHRLSSLTTPGAYVVLSGSLPPGVTPEFYSRAAQQIAQEGARCVLDTSGPALTEGLRQGVYLAKPNMRELTQLYGSDIHNEREQERAVQRLIADGKCEVVLLSLGAAGVLLATADGNERLRAPSVPIRSKVGAGDSMVAGVVLALSQGRPLRDSIRYGIAAGSAAVMTPGSELCRLADTEQLYESLVTIHAPPGV